MTRRFRYLLLTLMTLIAAGCVTLLPRININEDMTEYLPSDSRMREGLDSLKKNFPEIDMNAYVVKAMFTPEADSLGEELCAVEGIAGVTSVSSRDGHTLYQLSVTDGADPKAAAARISEKYGESVIVETNANSNMPDNMVTILIVGVIIVFGILFLMCSSFVEALLFILTIGMAVMMNMGTNAFLLSVSMMTNTIVAVLQLVLSMDYSIILMNRFRQVLSDEPDIDKAMHKALVSASSSILSSSFTTIVGLLALVFMKFRIGMDLGLVLAKGVFCSLVSIYTILPALTLACYKGIVATQKKVFLMPTDALAGFEMRFRIPLAVVFVALFLLSWRMSKRTELSYASIWESEISDVFPPQNVFSLLYRTADEGKVIGLCDSLSADPKVTMALSYPSMMQKKLTASQMYRQLGTLMAMLPAGTEMPVDEKLLSEENLRILYYACTHPQRNERMSLEEMIELAHSASESGLVPEGMDVDAMISGFMAPPAEEVEMEPEVLKEIPEQYESQTETVRVEADTVVAPEPVVETDLADLNPVGEEKGEDPYGLRGKYSFTKENISTPMSAAEMSDFLGFSKGQASAAYSMAGKRGKTAVMTPYEFINYMTGTVLKNKLLRKMISDKQAEGLFYIQDEMNAVLNAPEPPVQEDEEVEEVVVAETVVAEEPPVGAVFEPAVEAPAAVAAPEPVEETPMERLASMFASGRKYTSEQIWRALRRAHIDVVDRATLDLMFIYWGSLHDYDAQTALSVEELVDFLSGTVAVDDTYSAFVGDEARAELAGLDDTVKGGLGSLRKEGWSMAAVVTEYPLEAPETFGFIENTMESCVRTLGEDCYFVGESVMYKEMKDGFRKELTFLTILTVLSIFLIVALTFRSLLIPTILVMTVMTGVYVNVFFSGIGGHTMLYLAYLIVQSILMGATIDYGILFTNYYLGFRKDGQSKAESVKLAYKGSIHTIMTSGLIIISAPYIMSVLLSDPTICSILSSLTFGAIAAICLILFVLPAVLAACDKVLVRSYLR